MSTTVGELNVKLNLELARLDAQITQANGKIARMGKKMQGDMGSAGKAIAGAFGAIGVSLSVGALVGFGKSLIDLGGKITDLSAEANMTPRMFQLISATAMDAGVSMEDVAHASEHLRSQLQTAAENGADPLNKALSKFNLTAAGLRGLKPEDQFYVLGNVLATAADKQAAMNLVSDVFGAKIGPKMRTTLLQIAEGFDKIDTSKIVISDDQLKKLDDFGDMMGQVWLKAKVAAVDALDAIGEGLKGLGGQLADFGRKNFEVTKGSFFDELFRDKNEFIDHAPNILPGGVAEHAPKPQTKSQQLQTDMAAAARKAQEDALKADPLLADRELRAKTAKLVEDMKVMWGDKAVGELMQDRTPAKNMGVSTAPTDGYARIGLLTGQVANPELKKQTSLLQGIQLTLEKINSGVRESEAAFAN